MQLIVYCIIYSIIVDVKKNIISMIVYLSKLIRIELHVNWVTSLLTEIQLQNLSQYPALITIKNSNVKYI